MQNVKQPKTTVAMLHNDYMAKPGDFGIASYIEGAEILRERETKLLSINVDKANVSAIRNGEIVGVRYWDGNALQSGYVALSEIKAVFDRAGRAGSGPCDTVTHQAVLDALIDSNMIFLNHPHTYPISGSKWANFEVFEDAGVKTPHTELYDPSRIGKLLSQGMVFVKDDLGQGGLSQFTITSDGRSFAIKTPTKEGAEVKIFDTLKDATSFIADMTESGNYVMQNGINIYKPDGRPQSLRIMLMRDGNGELMPPITYGFIGTKGLDQSNFGLVGRVEQVDPTRILQQFEPIAEQLAESAPKVFKSLERRVGKPVGQIGADVILDKDGSLWYLEINCKPCMNSIRDLVDISEQWAGRVTSMIETPFEYLAHIGIKETKEIG